MNMNNVELCNNNTNFVELSNQYRAIISKISHEIRNPLTLIYSSLQLLETDVPAVSDSALFPQIKRDIQDTICLLKDISSLNRDSSTRKAAFSVSDLLSGIASSFHAISIEKHIYFLVDFDASIDELVFFGDRQLLREAVFNLLINAADALTADNQTSVCPLPADDRYSGFCEDFTPPSACSSSDCTPSIGKILFTAHTEDEQLILHVRDNGAGIPDEYLDSLFDPFVTHKKHGTGLGLSIVQNAAREHNGCLTLDTVCHGSDTYTDFCLTLPCKELPDK